MVGLAMSSGCSSGATTVRTTPAPESTVPAPEDRSLDVSYSAGIIELSFARLGQPFRSMYARVFVENNGAWLYFGLLGTAEADTPGELVTGDPNEIEVLDGVNTQPSADRYLAPSLNAGRYLICTALAETNNHRDVCGELVVP